MRIIDISLQLKKGMVNFPNDPLFEKEWTQSIPKNEWNLSRITMSTHAGTHMDAPLHVDENGSSVDEVNLKHCLGPCQVIDLVELPFGTGISREDLISKSVVPGSIVLLKTKNSERGFERFYEDFVFLEKSGCEYLLENSVMAVGIDALSIQNIDGDKKEGHSPLLDAGVVIYEGLNLVEVTEGEYFFVGLPLRIVDGEGSPVRAVLIEKDDKQVFA